jgi:hypothetical protein
MSQAEVDYQSVRQDFLPDFVVLTQQKKIA